jgi:TMEM175 potassium channel family protein
VDEKAISRQTDSSNNGAPPLQRSDTSRLEAFSDGVFAVAITLLILEIKVPPLNHATASGADLIRALLGQWPSLMAYVISFISILIMWVNHHEIFGIVTQVSRGVLFANGLLLLLITFVPFPTAVLAAYIDHEPARAAAAFYCGTFVLVNGAYNILWYSASRNRQLLNPNVTDVQITTIWKSYLGAFPIYVAATALALLNPFAGLALFALPSIVWARLRYTSKTEAFL